MEQQPFTAPQEPGEIKKESVWTRDLMNLGVGSILFGVLSLFIVPWLFGALAIGSGVRVWKKGGSEKTKGIIGIILGLIGIILNLVARFLLARS